MSTERSRKIEHEVKKIHSQIKLSALILRQRMADLCDEMASIGGTGNESAERNQ